jgi:hypothetical protein
VKVDEDRRIAIVDLGSSRRADRGRALRHDEKGNGAAAAIVAAPG